MELALDIMVWLFVAAFGLVVGSFLNVLVYRIPRRLDFVRGFSFCPDCQHRLGPADLVPVFSYLALGRKCRYCHKPISPRYMLVELTAGVLALCAWRAFVPRFGLAAAAAPAPNLSAPLLQANRWLAGDAAPILAAVLWFAVLSILLVVALIDADTMEIPDGLNIALAVCGILAALVGPEMALPARLIGALCVSVPLLVISLLIPGAFGGGDVKLMAAAGLLLGWQCTLLAAFIGIVIGGIWGVYLLASGKSGAKGHFAFGPALCVGIAVAMFFGDAIIGWYLGSFF
jgi:leader peptidase (prepilin peptidase)/N-methyltransferase